MSRPGFLEGVAVAAVGAFAFAILHGALGTVLPPGIAARWLAAAGGLAYLAYLLSRAPGRTGRVAAVTLLLAVTAGVLVVDPPFGLHLAAQTGVIWLVRSLAFYRSVLPALVDLGLVAAGLAAAAWAAAGTGSVGMTVWSLLLVQALAAWIPPELPRPGAGAGSGPDAGDRFRRAHRTADEAVRKLSNAR